MTIEELQTQLDQLKAQNYHLSQQNERLAFQLKRAAEEGRFGLHWLDVPEDFGPEADNGLPILKEVKDYALHSPDGKPTHVLIEGENYLALQCLSYTHAGKIDVIYIDPPYNTGESDFRYNDKFISPLDELYHSSWLSFMAKRLELAHRLLNDTGVIIIHIDEHEFHNLSLLMQEIFHSNEAGKKKNDLGVIIWNKLNPKGDSKGVSSIHEYILCYAKNKEKFLAQNQPLKRKKQNALQILKKAETIHKKIGKRLIIDDVKAILKAYDIPKEIWEYFKVDYDLDKANQEFKTWIKRQNFSGGEKAYEFIDKEGEVYQSVSMAWPNKEIASNEYFIPLLHPTTQTPCPVPERGWRNPPTTMKSLIDKGLIIFGLDDTTQPRRKYLLKENLFENTPSIHNYGGSDDDFFKLIDVRFPYPKPVEVAKYLISSIHPNPQIILDFFAGSGTTLHATMALNAEDGGQRQCILVTNNENNICEEVCYERNRRVMQGYTNAKGQAVAPLGNSLKYYRVGFVGKNHAQRANDEDLLTLAHHAGELLALAENTLYEIESTEAYQIFSNYPADFDSTQPIPTAPSDTEPTLDFGDIPKAVALPPRSYTCIYFQEDLGAFEAFCTLIRSYDKETAVYVFSWSEGEFDEYFEHQPNVRVKSIPEPILKIYRSINQN